MDLQVKLCSKRLTKNIDSLYLYIKLKGKWTYEKLNINVNKLEKYKEDYNNKLCEAENIRLERFYELSQNPDSINKKAIEKDVPPLYLFVGSYNRNGGSYRYVPDEIKDYLYDSLYLKVFPFHDLFDHVNRMKDRFRLQEPGDYECFSTFIRIKPHSYGNPKPYLSLSLIRNEKSIAVEYFAYPCTEIIQPQKREIVLDNSVVVRTINDKTKSSTKTYLMKDNLIGYTKIGKSVDVLKRERTLEAQNPNISLFAVCQQDIESELHKKYKEYRKRGEWFELKEQQIEEILKEYDFKRLEYRRK